MQLRKQLVQSRPEKLIARIALDAAHFAAFVDQNESRRDMYLFDFQAGGPPRLDI